MARSDLLQAFIHLANNWSAAIRHKDRVEVQGGDLEEAVARKQEVLNEAERCLRLVSTPEGMVQKK